METSRKLVQALGLLSLVVLSPLALAAGGGEQALERVEVQASPGLRHDVMRSCPQIATQLQQGLELAITRDQVEGSFPVYFELRGNQVVNAQAKRVPVNFRSTLRRVVKSLDCQDAASRDQPQRFGFVLDVYAEARQPQGGGQRVAIGLRPLDSF